MNDVVVGDEKLVSTTRASELSGYSKDYVGQLCRQEKLLCRRVSGHWYISEDSIRKYQEDGSSVNEKEASTKTTYGMKVGNVRDDSFNYDGVEFIATQRAADLTGYAQDYIGQLARNGEIEARKVGRRWFVGKDSLLTHKKHNDGLLAAVQARSSGLSTPGGEEHIEVGSNGETPVEIKIHTDVKPGDINFNVRYIAETDQPLVPKMTSREPAKKSYAPGDIEKTSAEYVGVREGAQAIRQKVTESRSRVPIAKDTASREDVRPPYTHREVKEVTFNPAIKRKKSSKGLFFFLLLIGIILAASGVYIYLFGLPSALVGFDPSTIVPEQILHDIQERYGEIFPGSEVKYSAE